MPASHATAPEPQSSFREEAGPSVAGCDCCFDVIEESLKYQVMKRLDPLAPDRLVLPDRAALDRVAENRRAFGKLQLEPVLGLQLIRPDHPKRTRGTRAIELFPEHRPGVVQTVSLPPRSRSDLRRPDTVEVRDERNDPLWRCRDNPLVAFPDLHPSLTSPHVPCDQCRDATVRSPRLRKRSCRAAASNEHLPRATDTRPTPPADGSGCFPPRTPPFPLPFVSPCCRP